MACALLWLVNGGFAHIPLSNLINPLRAKCFRGSNNMYLHFISFLHTDMTQVVEILLHKNIDLPTIHSQYHGYWWPGDARSQGISNRDTYYIEPAWFVPRT